MLKFLGTVPGAGEMNSVVLSFARTAELKDLGRFLNALRTAKIWANVWLATEEKVYIEVEDTLDADDIEDACKKAGL